jgi:EAL domain-containing protein (putative c-di-GMP-specific phosphodiesterase class I)
MHLSTAPAPGRLHAAHRRLSSELRDAIDGDELRLHFQPKLNLRTGDLVGVEALVRWQHPKRGFIGPGDFIPLAEQTGLITPLTWWVLDASLRQHAEWSARGLTVPIAVNVSIRTFTESDLAEVIARQRTRPTKLD